MRLKISQAAASIPLIGYALLWSNKLSEFGLQQELGDGWMTTTTRLLAIYYGALILTMAWVLYLFKCPDFIRKHPHPDDYIAQQMLIRNDLEFSQAIDHLRNYLLPKGAFDQEYKTNAPITLRNILKPVALNSRLRAPQNEFMGSMWHCYYLTKDCNQPIYILITIILLTAGTFLILTPSFEVFWLVTKKILIPGIFPS